MIDSWKKIAWVFLGLIALLFLGEAGLRLGSSVVSSLQEYSNLRSIRQKGVYRILCLGESTTEGGYPRFLEQILNRRSIGVRFSVIDKGIATTNTFFVLSHLESYLTDYHPDMVITMMGNTDLGNRYYQDIPEADTWIFWHSRLYRLARLRLMRFMKKISKDHRDKYSNSGQGPRMGQAVFGGADVSKGIPEPEEKDTLLNLRESVAHTAPTGRAFLEAEKSFFKVLKSDPQNDRALVGVGSLYLEHSNFPQADFFFKKAIAINPKNSDAYIGLGRLSREQGSFPMAERCFKKALELAPVGDQAYVEAGRLFQEEGKLLQAADSFQKAIALNPKSDEAYVGLGGLYLLEHEFAKSEESFNKAIEMNPHNDKAFAGLGRLYGKRGRFSKSEAFFLKAVELNPESDSNRNALGMIYRTEGKFEMAESAFKEAVALAPANMHNLFELVALLREQKKTFRG